MARTLVTNARIVNEGEVIEGDLLIRDGRIARVGGQITDRDADVIDAAGKVLMPGVIDDQVHFREPGLTHKADIAHESLAAAAGGTTSFMDMPNVKPATLTQELLRERYALGASRSAVNYSFYMGASNDNLEEVLRTDPSSVCGIKAFMGSSTGNMLVDDERTLDRLFAGSPTLIATHCEDEATVALATEAVRERLGEEATAYNHPEARPREACYKSSHLAIELAERHRTRLHILHLTTAEELAQFAAGPIADKHITAEVCIHHLTFAREDYLALGNQIKCNPAIKSTADREALWEALLSDRLDVIATDHAPHTREEKGQSYWNAPSGVPLVQHGLLQMHEHLLDGRLDWPTLVRKMCHAVADCFAVNGRGYLREGYCADLVLFDTQRHSAVDEHELYSKCGWSPYAGHTFRGSVDKTWVNGQLVYSEGAARRIPDAAQALSFRR